MTIWGVYLRSVNAMTNPPFKARVVRTKMFSDNQKVRSASLYLPISALAVLAWTACQSDHVAGDNWFFGSAYVKVMLRDTSGTPAGSVPVDVFLTRYACAGPDSSSGFVRHAQSDSIGKVNMNVGIPYGDSVSGCIWLHIRGAPTYRDTFAGQSALYVLDPSPNLDTVRFDITLNRTE